MKNPGTLLTILDRSETDHRLLMKAASLARQFNARLELFLCDAEHAYALKHEYQLSQSGEARHAEARDACVRDALAYLTQIQGTVDLCGLHTVQDAACESPLYEGIVHKVSQSGPGLVIKGACAETGGVFDSNDWQLMRKCPATLMMTRGRIWHTRPRIAALVDISAAETAGMAQSILDSAEALRAAHGGELDLVFVQPATFDQRSRRGREAELQELARTSHAHAARVHVLQGDPEALLPAFIREHDYDVLTLGALTHRDTVTPLVGSLTSRLVESVDCDFILVRPPRIQHGATVMSRSPSIRRRTARESAPILATDQAARNDFNSANNSSA